MRNRIQLIAGAALVSFAAAAHGQVTVRQDGSGDFTSINAAVAGTGPGEEIRVVDGATYTEDVSFTDRSIIADPPTATVSGKFLVFGNAPALIEGFAITGIAFDGVGIADKSPDVTLRNLAITGGTIGVYVVDASTVLVEDCVISGQTADGIQIINGTAEADIGPDVTVRDTQISSVFANGIGILRNSIVRLEGASITDCFRGIQTAGDQPDAFGYTILLEDTEITNPLNVGMDMNRRCRLELRNSSITGSLGQGIHFRLNAADNSTFLIQDSTISGSGIDNIRANRFIEDGVIERATITGAGERGINITGNNNGAVITIIDSDIHGNTGVGFRTDRRLTLEASGTKFRNNGGPGLELVGQGTNSVYAFLGCEFTGNTGDGLDLRRAVDLVVEDTLFAGNTRHGFYRDFVEGTNTAASDLVFRRSSFVDNGAHGLAVFMKNGRVDLAVEDSVFQGNGDRALMTEHNSDPSLGVRGEVVLQRNHFISTNDTSSPNVLLYDTLAGSLVENNLFERGREMLIVNRAAGMAVYHNTMVHSNERPASYGIFLVNGIDAMDIRNNLIAKTSYGIGALPETVFAGISFENNLVEAFTAPQEVGDIIGPSNIVGQDPLFVDFVLAEGEGDYTLLAASPALEAGDPTVPTTDDFNGDERPNPAGTDPDIGAFEMPAAAHVGDWIRMPY